MMKKRLYEKSKKKQEVLRWVYDPVADKMVLYDICPLFQKGKLEGRDWVIAEVLLKNFFLAVCDGLDIPEPDMKYSSSGFPSETIVTKYEAYDNTIYINKKYERNFGALVFGIASSLRIAWQGKEFSSWLSSLKRKSETSLEEFILQESMIDAAAYACLVIELIFDMETQPRFSGASLDEVNERKEYIYKEMLLEE